MLELLVKVKQKEDEYYTAIELYQKTYAELAEKVSAEYDGAVIKRIVNDEQVRRWLR